MQSLTQPRLLTAPALAAPPGGYVDGFVYPDEIPPMPEVRMTPEMAQHWLDTMSYHAQRNIRSHTVRQMAQDMRNGRFRSSILDVRTLEQEFEEAKHFLINGYHRLHAIIAAGIPIPLVVNRRIVRSEEDIAKDYAVMDRHLIRSHREGIAGSNLDIELGLPDYAIDFMGQAASQILGSFQTTYITGARALAKSTLLRVDFIRMWAEAGIKAAQVLGSGRVKRQRRLYNQACFAVVLVTFRYAPEAAAAFWGRVTAGSNLPDASPELALIDYVNDHIVQGTGNAYYSRAIATCWNAAYEGRQLRLIKVPDQNAPIRIAGTPYNGKQTFLGGPPGMKLLEPDEVK